MDTNTFPTKGNLMLARNTLALSKSGYDLLDKKRNVLLTEIMALSDKAKEIQADIDKIFKEAYTSLQFACIEMGMTNVERLSYGTKIDNSINIRSRSVMGVEIPVVTYDSDDKNLAAFGFGDTTAALDAALIGFNKVKELIIRLSMIESAAYYLAINIASTQKRANALKNITIPRYEELTKTIQETLEERERDEFTRLKVIKHQKNK